MTSKKKRYQIDRVYVASDASDSVELPEACPHCGAAFVADIRLPDYDGPLGEEQLEHATQPCAIVPEDDMRLGLWGVREYYEHPVVLGYSCRECHKHIAGPEPGVTKLAEGETALRTMWGFRPGERVGVPVTESPDYLHATTYIYGTPFHVAAIRVIEDDDGEPVAANPDFAHVLEEAENAHEPDGFFMTTKIPGYEGEYVMLIYPHSQ